MHNCRYISLNTERNAEYEAFVGLSFFLENHFPLQYTNNYIDEQRKRGNF